MDHTPSVKWPNKLERAQLWILLVVFLVFGAVVEYRSVFRNQPMTDAEVYFRTAWAVRAGTDIYDVMDPNGWHYQYPPFIAVMMTPLADPLPGVDRTWLLPYGVSIAVWYVFSLVCMALALHWLASAMEPALERALGVAIPRDSWSWWALRLYPFYICLPSIGRTLSRGQINLLVVMLFCAMAALLARKRSALAGMCLGTAIAIKLIPGFLLLYGIVRRDWRFLAGSAAGVLICGLLIPSMVMGSARTIQSYKKYYTVLLSPALTGGADKSRTEELLKMNGSDSQAFKAVINNTLHISVPGDKRPATATPWVLAAHMALVALLTGITLWFGRQTRPDDVIYNILFIGCLLAIMIPASPVSHTHYFVYLIPLAMALVAHEWERQRASRLGAGCKALFLTYVFLNIICLPVSFLVLKELGVSLYAALFLWAAGIRALRQRGETQGLPAVSPPSHAAA